MRRITSIILLGFLSLIALAQQRQVIPLNTGWEFSRDSLFSNAERVDLPHDFQISQPWVAPQADEQASKDAAANTKSRLSARGFKEMGTGWYRKVISYHAKDFKDRRVLLDFESILLVGDVFLNGRRIGGTDYGYVGFAIDITRQLNEGDNTLVVKASTMGEKNSRWYTGGGLTRHVCLVTTPADLYFERHPLYITTRDNRYVNIQAELTNRTKTKTTRLRLTIYDAKGHIVCSQTDTIRRQTPARTFEAKLREADIRQATLWDTTTPYLYRAVVQLLREDGTVADEATEHFGIRTIEIGPDYGLRLNGQKVLLKGVANHHTLGPLGAAAYPKAIEKQLRLLKCFGVNHIRTSHNPYSRDLIRLCDQLGLLVVDELYDKWTDLHSGGRSPFMNHWAYDVAEWVKRDRNAPSVVLWSLGNELQQDATQPFNDFGVTCYKMMKPVVQRYDSTRLTTVAMHPRYRNWQTDSLPCNLAMVTDVQSYNYRYMYFPGDGRRFPWMTFYQSEASTSSMGPNYYGMDLSKVIGLAYWGAIDYLGESQGWPDKGWAQGVIDIAWEPKPKAYLMKSLFTEEPLVHIAIVEDAQSDLMWNGVQTGNQRLSENWNRPADSMVSLYTFTNCDEVELRLNSKTLGRKANPADPQHRNQLRWDSIPYRQGKLEAIGYCRQARCASHAIETTGEAVRIVAQQEEEHWQADGQDLQYIRLTAVDKKGRRVWTADDQLSFTLQGDARIVAVANGNMASDESFTDHRRRLWNGSALVILRAGQKPSKVTLTTRSVHLKPITTILKTE
ncbi:MAG: DUF4982 domain-containing protein [Prevotella sp.]|nr:DUF4982 domain-containing protein [Prevotella sp.]